MGFHRYRLAPRPRSPVRTQLLSKTVGFIVARVPCAVGYFQRYSVYTLAMPGVVDRVVLSLFYHSQGLGGVRV